MSRTELPIPDWLPEAQRLCLSDNEVHVWRASLDLGPTPLLHIGRTLSPGERRRAARFRRPLDRNRFIAARGTLRNLLSRYFDRPPKSLEFDYGRRGKPQLRRQPSGPPIRFNLSHSYDLALYAFALGRDVGADLEFIRAEYPVMEVSERFFTAREIDELRSMPQESRAEGFFVFWTRKEAYIKAQGSGLKIPLSSFDVSDPAVPDSAQVTFTLPPLERVATEPRQVRGYRAATTEAHQCTLYSFQPAPGFVGCIACEGAASALRYFDYRG